MTCADPDLYDMLERPQALLLVCRGVQGAVVFTVQRCSAFCTLKTTADCTVVFRVQRCTVGTSMQFVKMYSIHYTVPGNFCAMFTGV